MKTNFFQQLADLGFNGNFLLNIHQDDTGVQTVSVVLKKGNIMGVVGTNLPPLLFKATAEELDDAFFEQLAQPVKQTTGIINNLEAYQKELEKAKKNAKTDKDKSAKTASADKDDDDDENDEAGNLFTPKEDDKQAKAEKKRLFDEAMEKVKALAKQMKYTEALAQLPDPAEYADKAELIEAKRQEIQKGKEVYDKLTEQFND
jgi:PRTRC genetic system protein E